MEARTWGYWTRGKLDLLRRYLDAFTTTTKYKVDERIYIDAFAGQAHTVTASQVSRSRVRRGSR